MWVQGAPARRKKFADVCIGVVFEISKGLLITDVAEVKVREEFSAWVEKSVVLNKEVKAITAIYREIATHEVEW